MDKKIESFICKQHFALLKVVQEAKKHLLEIMCTIHNLFGIDLVVLYFSLSLLPLDNFDVKYRIPVNHF